MAHLTAAMAKRRMTLAPHNNNVAAAISNTRFAFKSEQLLSLFGISVKQAAFLLSYK